MKKIFIGCMAFLTAFVFTCFIYGAVPASEREALIALYNSTGGDNWKDNSGWKDGTLEPDGFGPAGWEGTWKGITVSADHVSSIYLSNNNLIGGIPTDLENLTQLTSLVLATNQLGGNIPTQLGNIPTLRTLDLDNNQLTGTIPTELGKLSNLYSILLYKNQLTGTIPTQLGTLTNLVYLSLAENQLTGTIPTGLGNLTALYWLNLSDNQLTGAIPSQLGNLSNLNYLDLAENQLTGTIPPELGNLKALNTLYLYYNQLTGSIPPELGNLSSIVYLSLANNQLTGSIPPELGNLSNLTYFYLDNNQLTGSIPSELGSLSEISYFYLDNNRLTGSIPPELGNLSKVTRFFLFSNRLSGSIPPELGNLSKVTSFSLNSNQLTGSIPPELGNLPKVTVLAISSNQLSGSIPPELGKLSSLLSLSLESNQLTGSIPPELGNLSNLDHLTLNSNQLTGSIPPALGNLSKLTGLYLYSNRLSGSIPPELGNLSSLTHIRVHSNQLTGPFPTELQNLSNVEDGGGADFRWNGLYTGDAALRAFLFSKQVLTDWESTQTVSPTGLSAAALSQDSIRVSWTPTLYIADPGGYHVYYGTTSGGPWTYAGIIADKSASSYDVTGLNAATTYYFVVRTQTDAHTYNENTVVSDYSEQVSAATTAPLSEKNPPFGSFETPVHGSTVSGSIPVTGWALDDSGIASVKIYRAQGNSLIYIGDAIQVEGARPDVASDYPDYPNNTKAGWGYMLLTNFLPDGGNGTFVLHAVATDIVGKSTTLGTKTIICDNANAVKPFGALDTPAQGGTASGGDFVNWGWVLTPQPNSIPTDGSTINVFVDGVHLGQPTYNIYREDIAGLFPGCANSGGAIGYFSFDTAAYSNGVHTIYWTAEDDAGNADGIGSRYFSVQNTQNAGRTEGGRLRTEDGKGFADILIDYYGVVGVVKGYKPDVEPLAMYPDDKGTIVIEIEELGRVEIHFFESSSNGDARLFNISQLPIGSTLDGEKGIFYWSAGPGFIGDYPFAFIEETPNGKTITNIIIRILPKFALLNK